MLNTYRSTYNSTPTQKGQITIPVSFREKWGFKPGQKIFFEERSDGLMISKPIDISSLRGSIKSKIKYSDTKANKAVEKFVAQEYLNRFK